MISYLTKLNISLLLRASGHPELEILIQEERERRGSEGAGCITISFSSSTKLQ